MKKSKTLRQLLINLELSDCGGNKGHMKKVIQELNIDTSHFLGQSANKGKSPTNKRTREEFLTEVLIKNGVRKCNQDIKKKLIEYNIKQDICEVCGQVPLWNNKKLILQLDHIDGDNTNNEIVNLRIICPNCHTQTKTYAGRKTTKNNINKKGHHKVNKKLKEQIIKNKIIEKENKIKLKKLEKEKKIKKRLKKLKKNNKKLKQLEKERIINEKLEILNKIDITKLGWIQKAAVKWKVSHTAVRKWVKKYYPDLECYKR